MYDITLDLQGYNNIDVKDGFNQSGILFNTRKGTNQIVSSQHAPFISFDINFLNISDSDYNTLKTKVKTYFNSFVLYHDYQLDDRYKLVDNNMQVFMVVDFQFSKSAATRWTGKVSLTSSVKFNYLKYTTNVLNEDLTDTYTSSNIATIETGFDDLLSDCGYYKIDESFMADARLSNIGVNTNQVFAKYIKDKHKFYWLLTEEQFYILKNFYHINGKYKSFGYNGYEYRFVSDTMDFNKNNTGLYPVSLEIESVLNVS